MWKEPEEAFPNPKLADVLDKYKHSVDFGYLLQTSSGAMFNHQNVFIDEKNLAQSEFREAGRSRSLKEYASGTQDFYEKAKEYEKQLNTQKKEEQELEEEIKAGIRGKQIA